MSDLVIVGDQAYFPDEWERIERKRALDRERQRENRKRPEVRAARSRYMKVWRDRNRDKYLASHREWMRAYRARRWVDKPRPVGFLHSLACFAPHWRDRKGCQPIPVYSRRVESVA